MRPGRGPSPRRLRLAIQVSAHHGSGDVRAGLLVKGYEVSRLVGLLRLVRDVSAVVRCGFHSIAFLRILRC